MAGREYKQRERYLHWKFEKFDVIFNLLLHSFLINSLYVVSKNIVRTELINVDMKDIRRVVRQCE